MPELIPEWVDLELLEAAACLNRSCYSRHSPAWSCRT